MQNTRHNSRTDKDNAPFNAEEFSSRKLMDLVDQNQHRERLDIDTEMLMAVVTELTQRRHYLRELRDRGLLAPRSY
jgi:CBS-domain-containing membrane protein